MKAISKFIAVALLAIVAVSANAQTVVNISTLVDGSGNLLSNPTTLNNENIYKLDSRMYVRSGEVLNIEPGTVIKGISSADPLAANAVIVCRGGKIYAIGTETNPIVFTADADPMDGTYSYTNTAKWGGVIILGYATNNVLDADACGVADGLGSIEGLSMLDSRHHYGADINGTVGTAETFNDSDNSGVLKYVSIRHGGAVIGAANEINGLTLGSVGRGTTIEHVEIIANEDDGIEFFGGTVDIKYVSILFCKDDYLDWDQGFDGRCQFIYGVQLPNTDPAYEQGNHGFECDGDDGSGHTNQSDPKIFNATMIGGLHADGDKALEMKANTKGTIKNSIFANYDKTIAVATGSTPVIESNTFINCTDVTGLTYGTNNVVGDNGVIGIDYTLEVSGTSVTGAVNPVPNTGSVNTTIAPPVDDFFEQVSYKGAFAPGLTPWTANWSIVDTYDLDNSVVACPEDVTGNGFVDVDDILDLLIKFNQSCGN